MDIGALPSNILADRLKRLEREGLIESFLYREHPPRFSYSLTPDGRELGRAVDALATWGLGHFAGAVMTALTSEDSNISQ